MQAVHGGYAISTRTGGALERRINETLDLLEAIPLACRDELWAAAIGGARYASELLAGGRRAKAGKVLANVRSIIEQPAQEAA